YYAQLRRRVLLGLSEPVVADRMLLWGIGSVARAGLVLVGPVSGRYLATLPEAGRISSGAVALVSSSPLGVVPAGRYLPARPRPRGYLRWVEQRAARRRAV